MSSPSPSSLDSVGTSPLGSFSDPNEHPLLALDLGLGPLVGYGDNGVFNSINNSQTAFSCSSLLTNSALSLYLNGLGSGNLESIGSTHKVCASENMTTGMLEKREKYPGQNDGHLFVCCEAGGCHGNGGMGENR
jgi:hypothetical protein